MAKTILVVDDSLINRKILVRGLDNDYDILEAENGREALTVIRAHYDRISAVLLDLQMPVMDGFTVLQAIRSDPVFGLMPVIVVTGSESEETRIKALSLGANDFIQKPYNPEIIRHCLENNITLREMTTAVSAFQNDRLTGIPTRENFFGKAGELIKSHKADTYILACLDIDNFKIINDQYGAAEGDNILRHIGSALRQTFDGIEGLCGRISGDNFAALFPNRPEVVRYVSECSKTTFIPNDTSARIRFSIGCYIITDTGLPVSTLYDRANIAKQSVKGRYDARLAYFDDSMLRKLVLEQEIIGEMDRALNAREFEVWLQPQYNHATGALVGAEALARWRHPVRGMISPADFIPVFEKNGFVYELDKYVWERTCEYLRKWLDEGRDPLPVSVNISRSDVFREDLTDVLTDLLNKYNLPAQLLRLEITESAFSEESEQIISTVKRFIEKGFTVEIDDFGSGYSSLNTLKDVPAQILKLDMRFLEGNGSTQRSGSILESIVRMARWIGMAVIAEGVETLEQADFLKSIGCTYVQGYLYGKPMPFDEYDKLARRTAKEERLISSEAVVNLDSDCFWNPDSLDTLIFNSFVGGACIFEFYRGKAELLRINDNYRRELGIDADSSLPLEQLDPFNFLDETGKKTVRACAEQAVKLETEQSCEAILRADGVHLKQEEYLRCSFRVIAKAGDRFLFYCLITNISAQRKAEQNEREAEEKRRRSEEERLAAAGQLQAIIGNIDGGVTASVHRQSGVQYIYSNDRFYELLGCTRREYEAEFHGSLLTVHPDDRQRVTELAARASRQRSSYSVEFRIIRSDGAIRWLRSNVTIMSLSGISEPVQLAVTMDITAQAEATEQLRFLNNMAHELLAKPDMEEGLNAVLQKLRESFGGARAYIFEFNTEKQTASNTYESCAEGVSREKDNLQNVPMEVMSFWLDTFARQDYLSIESIDALGDERAEEKRILQAQGIRSIFAAPLYREGEMIGMIGIDDPTRRFTQMNNLSALGDYIAVMLSRRDLKSQITGEDRTLLLNQNTQSAGLREALRTGYPHRELPAPRVFLIITLAFCLIMTALLVFATPGRAYSAAGSFSETVITMRDGWTLTDSAGTARKTELPLTIEYGTDGRYTLTGTLPDADGIIESPALCIYSNYVDLYVELDGEPLLVYPDEETPYRGGTGNTYHFIRLPVGYGGKTLTVSITCQLGDGITYLLKAPTLGSKATVLYAGITESLPAILLTGCMFVLAFILAVLHIFLKRRLALNSSTAYTAIFAMLFAVYVYSETIFAQLLASNSRALFSMTLMLLALLPIPLMGLFSEEVSSRFRRVPTWLMMLCSANFIVQVIANYTGISSFRVMLPATHVVIVMAITATVVCLLLSDRKEKPDARKKLIYALPMIVGGTADIVLLALNSPSFNNSLWFTLGVTSFIVIQFCDFVRSFFLMYRSSLETGALRDMAYRDTLTNIGNRNAYERKLKALTERGSLKNLCCLVIDINDLKQINDRNGHQVGDAAIVETGRILGEYVPKGASCYRTGGDEFVVFIDGSDTAHLQSLTDKLSRETERRGKRYSIPLSLAIGYGQYEPGDGNIIDFVRRVDARMYEEKKQYKDARDHRQPVSACPAANDSQQKGEGMENK